MITRHTTLSQALTQVEDGTLKGVATVVVAREWWKGLTMRERADYKQRAKQLGVTVRSDSRISNHYVEARGKDTGGLSTERAT